MFRSSRTSNMIVIYVVGMCLPKGSWKILIDSVAETNPSKVNSQQYSLRFPKPNIYMSVSL
jgi:hypothetical protein